LLARSNGWLFSASYVEDSPLCLMWTKWREWNARIFEDREKSKEELLNILVKSLFNWIGAYDISNFSNYSGFVDFCSSFSL
jgi:hypothetical protein